MLLSEQIILLGTPIARSVAGWLHNALEDGTISLIEWKKLTKTVLRMLLPALALYYGFETSAELSAALPLIGEYAFEYFKKFKK